MRTPSNCKLLHTHHNPSPNRPSSFPSVPSVVQQLFPLESRCIGAKSLPKKKRPKPFRAVIAVKELARERVGAPPAEKIVIEKKKKPEKHKPTLGKLLEDV